ncbi:hypothetical protein G4B88_027547 [Cannabis sativa]|uniref:SCP domain-containing protein n=1 Tax=Cannabis sativa TaxID=3483 RepID=A0A7J6G6L7_CANSA|nr:hypothetical protein G4B88_027547 [Cannabis sativa]
MAFYRVSVSLIICILGLVAMLESCNGQDSPQDYLALHNRARAQVGVGPMRWDNTVAAYAQNYANQLAWGDCSYPLQWKLWRELGRGKRWLPIIRGRCCEDVGG